jgi:hypothetical protein
MDLRSWISAELTSIHDRIERGIVGVVPIERWREHNSGLTAPVYVAWHTARHHDVAVNAILRDRGEILDEWHDRVGITDDTWRGLAEGEDHELVDELDPDAVSQYLLAVLRATVMWLAERGVPDLAVIPDSHRALSRLGTPTDRFDWLYSMWDGKPAQFFLSWEAVGHGFVHLGELTAIRNRMGLSPF